MAKPKPLPRWIGPRVLYTFGVVLAAGWCVGILSSVPSSAPWATAVIRTQDSDESPATIRKAGPNAGLSEVAELIRDVNFRHGVWGTELAAAVQEFVVEEASEDDCPAIELRALAATQEKASAAIETLFEAAQELAVVGRQRAAEGRADEAEATAAASEQRVREALAALTRFEEQQALLVIDAREAAADTVALADEEQSPVVDDVTTEELQLADQEAESTAVLGPREELDRQLQQAIVQRNQLLAKFTELHPRVRAAEARIEEVRTELAEFDRTLSAIAEGGTPRLSEPFPAVNAAEAPALEIDERADEALAANQARKTEITAASVETRNRLHNELAEVTEAHSQSLAELRAARQQAAQARGGSLELVAGSAGVVLPPDSALQASVASSCRWAVLLGLVAASGRWRRMAFFRSTRELGDALGLPILGTIQSGRRSWLLFGLRRAASVSGPLRLGAEATLVVLIGWLAFLAANSPDFLPALRDNPVGALAWLAEQLRQSIRAGAATVGIG